MDNKTIWQKLKRPRGFFLAFVYIVTILCIAGALTMLFVDQTPLWTQILAYVWYALAAVTLAYSTYTIVIYAKGFKQRVQDWMHSKPFIHKLLDNFGFRTVVTSLFSLAMTLFVAVAHAWLGISEKSIWYGALAAYYLMLVALRSGVLLTHKKHHDDTTADKLRSIKSYRNCGILLLILNVSLSAAIAQMIFDDRAFVYVGWTVFAFAAYAFYKITMSIINIFKAKKYNSFTVQAIRNVNLADAMVSILALQTALLWSFSAGEVDISLFNTLTGCIVSFGTIALGVFMIRQASRHKKKLLEKQNGQQSI